MCGRRDVDPSARLEKRELTQKRSFKAKIKELKNKTNKRPSRAGARDHNTRNHQGTHELTDTQPQGAMRQGAMRQGASGESDNNYKR